MKEILEKDELSKGEAKAKRPKKATMKFDPVDESTPIAKPKKSGAKPIVQSQSQGERKLKVGSHSSIGICTSSLLKLW